MNDRTNVNLEEPGTYEPTINEPLPGPPEADATFAEDATFAFRRPQTKPGRWPVGPAYAREKIAPATFDVWALLEPCLRRWPFVVITGAGATALGLLLGLTLWHTSFTSTAKLVRYDPPVATDAFKPQPLATPTLIGMIMSPDVLQHVGDDLNPPLSAKELSGRLNLTPERNSDIVTVTASGDDPAALTRLVNRFDSEALRYTQNMQRKEAVEADNYVAQQLAETEADIAATRHQVPTTIQVPTEASSSPDVLAEKIQAAREELANLLLSYTDAHPLVKAQRAKIEALVSQFGEGGAPKKISAGRSLPAPRNTTAPSVESAAPQPAGPREDYEVLVNHLRSLEDNHAQLVNRKRAIQVFRANPPGYFRLLLPAREEEAVIQRPWLKIGLAALFCGLVGVIAAAGETFFSELLDNRLKTGSDVKRVTRLPLLATLGDLRRMTASRREDWAFRAWIAIQNRLRLSPNHSLVCGITSANQGDGRSTWIHLLAKAASQNGFRVLTITTKPAATDGKNGKKEVGRQYIANPSFTSPESRRLTEIALSSPGEVAERLMAADPSPILHIPLPGWAWDMEQRKQWEAALNLWRKIDNTVILVELPPASVPEAVLLAENLPNLVWLSTSSKSNAAETFQQVKTLRDAHCNLVGAALNREPRPLINGRFTRWLGGSIALLLALCLLPGGLKADPLSAITVAQADAPQESGPGTYSIAAPIQRAAWQQRLTLGPGDLLNLSLFGQPELSRQEVPVGPDGRVSYLEAQNVLAAGLTVDEFREKLSEALGQYRRSPQVLVIPAAFHSKKYFMLGRVVQKGVFPLDRPITILEAVAIAHGFETDLTQRNVVELADLSHSFLARQGRHMSVDFEKLFLAGDLSQNIPLEPDDYLYFPSDDVKEVYVLGEVNAPGPLTLTSQTTALEAVAGRGGFTERAWKQHLLVVRGSLNHPQTFVVNAADVLSADAPDFKLEPRDIVFVSNRPWIRAEELLDTAATAFVESAVVTWTGLHVDPIR
jgi:protein involved in polysaccharide export with SLBB domain/capsular polysaccharide biosynthesis protein